MGAAKSSDASTQPASSPPLTSVPTAFVSFPTAPVASTTDERKAPRFAEPRNHEPEEGYYGSVDHRQSDYFDDDDLIDGAADSSSGSLTGKLEAQEEAKAENPYRRGSGAARKQRKRLKCSRSMRVDDIRYTQASVRDCFTDGVRIQLVIDSLKAGSTRIKDVPVMRVVLHEGFYHSLDNRRLFCFKCLRQHLGRDISVPVLVVEKTAEFWNKFRTRNGGCSVQLRH
jgi:hypothetical protein